MHPGFGITRIRFNGYNLSLIVRHPFEISTAKVIKRFGKSGAVCEEFVKIAIRPDPAAVRRFRKAGNAVTRDIYPCCCVTADNFYLRIRPARSFSSARASACLPGPVRFSRSAPVLSCPARSSGSPAMSVFAAVQSPFFRQSFDISSRVLPLVSGTHFQTKRAEASDIRA